MDKRTEEILAVLNGEIALRKDSLRFALEHGFTLPSTVEVVDALNEAISIVKQCRKPNVEVRGYSATDLIEVVDLMRKHDITPEQLGTILRFLRRETSEI